MTWHAYDAAGWFTGPAEVDAPGATPDAPPIDSTDDTPDTLRARWWRHSWRVEAYPAPAPVVPVSVTRRQAMRALALSGLLEAVEAAIEALPEPDRTLARIDWQDAATFDRSNATLAALAAALGLTEVQLDELFALAAAQTP